MLKTILIILLCLYVAWWVAVRVVRMAMRGVIEQMTQGQGRRGDPDQDPGTPSGGRRGPGQSAAPPAGPRLPRDVGQYVDYEEIKERPKA